MEQSQEDFEAMMTQPASHNSNPMHEREFVVCDGCKKKIYIDGGPNQHDLYCFYAGYPGKQLLKEGLGKKPPEDNDEIIIIIKSPEQIAQEEAERKAEEEARAKMFESFTQEQ